MTIADINWLIVPTLQYNIKWCHLNKDDIYGIWMRKYYDLCKLHSLRNTFHDI